MAVKKIKKPKKSPTWEQLHREYYGNVDKESGYGNRANFKG